MSKYTFTVSFDTAADLALFAAGIASAVGNVQKPAGETANPPAAGVKAKDRPSPKSESKAAAASSAPETQGASTASSNKPDESAEKAVDYETEVKPLVLKLSAIPGGGRDAVLATLKEFGVAKGSEVKADKLPGFKAALEDAIAGLEAAQ
jgi:hypothetical protein